MNVAPTLAAIAAFTAAAFSLVGVVVSARMTRRGRFDEWRRDQERPIVARLLTLSDEAAGEWDKTFDQRFRLQHASRSEQDKQRDEYEKQREAADELRRKIRFEVAQLEVVAAPAVRKTALDLYRAHTDLLASTRVRKSSREPGFVGPEVSECQERLVQAARADLGVDQPAKQARWLDTLAYWPA